MINRPYITLFLVVLALKLSYLALTAMVWQAHPEAFIKERGIWQSTYANNDAVWYLNISKWGYPKVESPEELGCCRADCFHQSEYAFFPLFPWTIRVGSLITGGNHFISAFLLSLIFAFMAAAALFAFARLWWNDKRKAIACSLVILLMPFHYFFGMIYTEAIYLALLVICFLGIHRNRIGWTAIAFSLLAVCRPTGVLMGLPLLCFMAEKQTGRNAFASIGAVKAMSFWKDQWIWLPAAATFGAYLLFQYQMTGNALAFTAAQAGWCKEFMFPLSALFMTGELLDQFNSFYTMAFILLAASMLFISRIPLSFHLVIWISLLLPLSSGTPISMPRYISVIFPFFFVIGGFIGRQQRMWPYLVILFILQVLSLHYWVHAPHPLGM